MTVRIAFLFIVLAALVGVVAAFVIWQRTTDVVIAPIGPTTESVDDIDITFYSQVDRKWANAKLGRSGYTLTSSGCTLCCIAMALSTPLDRIPPDELNGYLTEKGGYTDGGLIIWKQIQIRNDRRIVPVTTSHDTILDNLRRRAPVIARVSIQGGLVHWVLIVGVRDGRYRVADPLDDAYTGKFLDQISDGIYAIRVLKSR